MHAYMFLGQHLCPNGIYCTTCRQFFNSPKAIQLHWVRTKCTKTGRMNKEKYKQEFEELEAKADNTDIVVNPFITKHLPLEIMNQSTHRLQMY